MSKEMNKLHTKFCKEENYDTSYSTCGNYRDEYVEWLEDRFKKLKVAFAKELRERGHT